MGLITKVRSRVKSSKAATKCSSNKLLTYQQEQLFGLHLSQSGLILSDQFGKTPSPHGIYYNLLGCPRSRKSYYNYDCNFQKNPETLVMLLLLPMMMGRIGLFYACILYQYPLHTIFDWAKKWVLKGFSHVKAVSFRIYAGLDKCERSFVNMNLYTMVNQMVFFMVCDRAVGLQDRERVTSLYSLLFYNVLAYCFSYVKEVIEKENWDLSVNLTPSSQVRHLAMSSTRILLEWIKAVTFIVTVVCMLLVLGLEQGLDHYCPTRFYISITLIYYILTEKLIQSSLPNVLLLLPTRLGLQDEICGLEKPVSALIIKSLTILLNLAVLLLPLLWVPPKLPLSLNSIKILLVTLYFNVWLQYKSSLVIKSQVEGELRIVASFRVASQEELKSHDDVCAICLTPLEYARVTPCQHLFHANCLRLCLKAAGNNLCPICKREFRFH